jgi:2,3-bisphosphoglycerate-independent phosphoglycerate mutase
MPKYIMLVGDGMGDYPLEEIDNKTPLEVASTANMDFITSNGILGLVQTIPNGMSPGSDVANMSLLGFDPKKYYTGRGPIEAASLGINVKPEDTVFRCNLVTLTEKNGSILMEDYSGGHISSKEAKELIFGLNKHLLSAKFCFYAGVSYRHILIWHKTEKNLTTIPPHDLIGQPITDYLLGLPVEIRELIEQTRKILIKHPINQKKISNGQKPANSIWLWGEGKMVQLPNFKETFGLNGAVISAVDLIKGIGILGGLKVIDVPGATGYLDTNYRAKAQYAIRALEETDFVYVHVEAPDEASHEGNLCAKIKAIEAFDTQVVGPVLKQALKQNYKIMVTTDHYTPLSLRTHIAKPVPFAIFSSKKKCKTSPRVFCEKTAQKNEILVKPGYELIKIFLKS